jgi:poly-gamma-glutamate capsule biosynthesis protein CapA/YwtB (metallophosphatase superfamily)
MLTVALSGDVIPLKSLKEQGQATNGDVIAILKHLHDADISVGNFEMPMTNSSEPLHKLLNIRADPKIATDLDILGLDVVTVANNHTSDYGWTGLVDTVNALQHIGLKVVGSGQCLTDACAAADFVVREKRVGIVAFSCLVPTGSGASTDRPGISGIEISTAYEIDPYYQMEEPGDPSAIKIRTRVTDSSLAFASDCVRALRTEYDILVVSVHWGFGSGEELATYQRPLAHALIDAGADIIHGHHPHAIHPIEIYKGKPIFYGLGTLVGQQVFLDAPQEVKRMWQEMSPDGLIATISFTNSGEPKIKLFPHVLNGERLPVQPDATTNERIHRRLERLCAPLGTIIRDANEFYSVEFSAPEHECRNGANQPQ